MAMHVSTGVGQYVGEASAPKGLGIQPRVDGLDSGLANLVEQLSTFADKVLGIEPVATGSSLNVSAPRAPSIPDTLDSAEARLRRCFNVMSRLNDAF